MDMVDERAGCKYEVRVELEAYIGEPDCVRSSRDGKAIIVRVEIGEGAGGGGPIIINGVRL